MLPRAMPRGAYAEAEQRHYDRLAAIKRHFGQQVARRGNPMPATPSLSS
jgi:hypothetical protein